MSAERLQLTGEAAVGGRHFRHRGRVSDRSALAR